MGTKKYNINESVIKQFWNLINPNNDNHKFQVFKKDGSATRQKDVNTPEKLVELCNKHNLEGLSCLSINPRLKGKTKTESVTSISNLLIDIDIKKQRKKKGISTPDDKAIAEKTAKSIFALLTEKINLQVSLIADSGNGFHIYIPVYIDLSNFFTGKNDDENKHIWDSSEHKKKLVYLEQLLKEFNNDIVEIDCISKDIVRRVKIPGTWNVKEGIPEKNYRCAKITYSEEVSKAYIDGNTQVFNSFEPATDDKEDAAEIIEKPQDFEELLQCDKKLRDLYNGNWDQEPYKLRADGAPRDKWSKSEAEHSLICKMIWYETPKNQIFQLMKGCKIGKWQKSKKKYQEHQYNSAADYIKKHGGSRSAVVEIIPSKINAILEGKKVKLTGRIVAERRKKAIPKTIKWICRSCPQECIRILPVPSREPFIFKGKKTIDKVVGEINLKPVCEGEELKENVKPSWFGTPNEYDDYTMLWLNDRLEDQDDLMASDQSIMVALVGHEIPKRRIVSVTGNVAVNPYTSDLVVIAYAIEEVGTSSENLILDDDIKKDFKKHFGDISKILHQIAPDMVGRDIVRHSRLLVLHSPPFIPDINNHKNIRGCLREVLFGDTKTNKSESIKDVMKKYHFGEWCSAETGSRAGLLYSVDNDKKTISWGIIPLSDLGYIGVESINALHSDQWCAFREVLEDQRIKVTMSVQGVANCRTRITATMNPPKNMNEYLCKCEAIRDTYVFKNPPDITRWDIFIPFSYDDVRQEDIINRVTIERPIPDDVFAKHIYWSWNLQPDDITYDDAAKNRIKTATKQITEDFSTLGVPVVHSATRDTITRLAVATACLNHSTEDCSTLKVKKQDVKEAVAFYNNMLDNLELRFYRSLELGSMSITDDDISKMIDDFDDIHIQIINMLMLKPLSSTILATSLGKSEKTIKRKYDVLNQYDLITTIPGKGVSLSKKGIAFVKKIHELQKTQKKRCPQFSKGNVPMSLMVLRELKENIDNADDGQQTIENNHSARELTGDMGTSITRDRDIENYEKKKIPDQKEDFTRFYEYTIKKVDSEKCFDWDDDLKSFIKNKLEKQDPDFWINKKIEDGVLEEPILGKLRFLHDFGGDNE